MALTKHASFRVLSARIAQEGSPRMRTAHKADFQYDPKPGFLYVRSRAISSRVNDNFDGFPAEEIKKAYRTFIGKPVFVNHHNANHRRARGVIIDAVLHEDSNPDGSPDTWAEVLMEVDALKFPRLAQAIVKGWIERTSMGTDVEYSVCSACGNKASSPVDYCVHIPRQKGKRIYRATPSGAKEGVLIYEECFGLSFFENSLLVEEPADPTALTLGVTADAETLALLNVDPGSSVAYMANQASRDAELRRDRGVGGQVPVTASRRARSDSYENPERVPSDGTAMVPSRDIKIGDRFMAEKESHLVTSKMAATTLNDVERTTAPAQVDTLRDEQCPVCGEVDSYDGKICQVCGFVTPPSEFMDPDVSKAQQVDLRQDGDDVGAQTLVCNSCGAQFSGGTKIAVVLDRNKGQQDAQGSDTSLAAGDICPECNEGTLQAASDVTDDASVDDGFAPAGSAGGVEVEVDEDGFAPAGSADQDPDVDPDNPAIPSDPPPAKTDAKDPSDVSSNDDEDEDEEDDDKPDFLKKKKPTAARRGSANSKDESRDMRPALKALAEQQQQIKALTDLVTIIASAAGISNNPRVASLLKRAADDENPANSGWATPKGGTEEAASETTDEARNSGATDNARGIGASPLTNVSPTKTDSPSNIGTSIDAPLNLNQEDVTAPVAGSDDLGEGPRGQAGSGRTEIDVRVGDPMNPQTAFDDGGFLSKGAPADRTMASLRLARLQIQAGIAVGDDLEIGSIIAAGARSNQSIQDEIGTLTKVVTAMGGGASQGRRQPLSRSLVPQVARNAARTPSLSAEASFETPQPQVSTAVSADEVLFE